MAVNQKLNGGNEDPYRLKYHLMPPTGWLNDPNGLCQYHGVYHVYFQYVQEDAKGAGKKCWGHYTSRDLFSWKFEGIFLLPDQEFDRGGVYSGCALTDDEGMHFFYTGNVKEEGDYDYIHAGRKATQVLVSSKDGKEHGEKKVLLTNRDYPDYCTCHVRDPKVWRENGSYYMVLGARIEPEAGGENRGAVLLYRSENRESWTYVRTVTTAEPFGYMWECPDYLVFGNEAFLSVSPQGLVRGKFENQNVYQSGYMKMAGSITEGAPVEEGSFCEWDMGFDFYAPQTFVDESGRRILIGWMGHPDIDEEYENPTVESGWQHTMTVPREITCRDGILYQQPVKEFENLRTESRQIKNGETLAFAEGIFEIIIDEIEADTCRVCFDENLVLNYEAGVFSMEFLNESGAGRTIRRARTEQLQDIRILVDTSSIEVFLNGGSTVFTTRYYPENREQKLTVWCEKSRNVAWNLKSPAKQNLI